MRERGGREGRKGGRRGKEGGMGGGRDRGMGSGEQGFEKYRLCAWHTRQ